MKDFKLVHAYFVSKKIKELSEEDFINHWENIFFITLRAMAET